MSSATDTAADVNAATTESTPVAPPSSSSQSPPAPEPQQSPASDPTGEGEPNVPTGTADKPSQQQKKKAANSYYYWHGHEKERAAVGDVAPLPTPVLVKRDETPSPTTAAAAQTFPVSKYSWGDGEKSVSVYVDVLNPTVTAEEALVEDSVTVEFKKSSLNLTFAVQLTSGGKRYKRLFLQLAKKVDPDACSFKLKPASKQIYIKLVKAEAGTWFDLVGKSAIPSSDEDETEKKEEEEEEEEGERRSDMKELEKMAEAQETDDAAQGITADEEAPKE